MGSITELSANLSPTQLQHAKLQVALEDAGIRYMKSNERSKKVHEEACKYMPGGNTRTSLYALPFPLTIQSAESCYLSSIDGHEYIDFMGEYTAGIYGHNNPVIRRAVERALDAGWNYGGHTYMEVKLAQKVCERFPAMKLVRFVNSGTEANTMALATAVAYTGKKSILIFKGGYHGGTISGKAVPGQPSTNLPHDFVIGNYNDVEGTRDLINTKKNDLAAILVEPVIGSGGCFPAKPEFLRMLRELATQHSLILILDEVMTSRLSYHGLGHAHDIVPDMMTIGKWVGGGLTFGAFGGRKDLMSMYDPRASNKLDHAGTFNNNIFTMTTGVAGCELMDHEHIARLNDLGESMRTSIEQILKIHGIEGEVPTAPMFDPLGSADGKTRPPKMFVTGTGSLMSVHFAGCEQQVLQGLYYHHMLAYGIYISQRGFVALNMEIKQTHVDRFLDATDKFCQLYEKVLRL